jgi:hypothetical protein
MHTIHRVFPALVLFVVAPLFAELLFGSTTVTRLGALTVVVPMYGGAAVLIRELARRRRHPWLRIVLFGLAYGIVEEGLVFRSIFDPVLFGASAFGGRALGVNWVWACWVTGYHLVWSVIIPIAFIETIFRSREPWLRSVPFFTAPERRRSAITFVRTCRPRSNCPTVSFFGARSRPRCLYLRPSFFRLVP